MDAAIAEDLPALNIWDDHWDFRPEDCPCDADLVGWLDAEGQDAAIDHLGTGGHHHVGIECAKPERRNHVLAITAARRSMTASCASSAPGPEILRYYTAHLGDIDLLNERLLPVFDWEGEGACRRVADFRSLVACRKT